jgi:PAS domain S-box-containing protein
MGESDEKGHSIGSTAPNGTAQAAVGEGYTEVNDRVCETLGYTREELLAKSWKEITYPEDHEAHLSLLVRMKSGEIDEYSTELRFVARDGRTVNASVAAKRVREEESSIDGIFFFVSDLPRRKHLQDALRESEERYRRIIATVTDYVFTVRVEDGKAVETIHGPACEAVTGYTSEEFSSDPFLWLSMVIEEDRDAVREQASNVLSSESFEPVEHRIWRKDGQVRWVNNTPVPFHDETGKLRSYDGLIRDITNRKRVEEALRESEERYRTVSEFSSDWVYWQGPDRSLRYVSPACETVTGYTVDEFMELPHLFEDVIHPEDLRIWKERGHATLDNRSPLPLEFRIRTKDGQVRWVSNISRPIHDACGKYLGIRGSNRDITERKFAEEEREQLIADLQEALAKIKTLGGLLPICSACKRIRDDKGYWNQIESYIHEHSEADFSHSICPECARKLYPEVFDKKK